MTWVSMRRTCCCLRKSSYDKRRLLCGSRAEGMEGTTRPGGQAFWILSSEEVLREIAPGRNRLLYLWGHLTAMHDAMLPLLGLGDRFHPEFDVAFVSNPDKSQAAIPSHEQVRQAWKTVNGELSKGFEKMSWSDWLQRHTAVSEEDFAKDASRNRFAILLSRTNHLSYHLGQAVLALK